MPDRFSNRYGYGRRTNPAREVAPESVRVGLREVLKKIGFTTPSPQRQIICEALRARPDPYNWSEYPNIDTEVERLIHDIEWFTFYDLCEKLNALEEVREKGVMSDYSGTLFAHEMNKIFAEENVVYRFKEDGYIYPEGTREFEQATNEAIEQLNEPEFAAPLEQFEKALGFRNDLPPDHPNAIKEAANSLEAILQIVSGRPGTALPQLLTQSTLGYYF